MRIACGRADAQDHLDDDPDRQRSTAQFTPHLFAHGILVILGRQPPLEVRRSELLEEGSVIRNTSSLATIDISIRVFAHAIHDSFTARTHRPTEALRSLRLARLETANPTSARWHAETS